MSKLRKSARGRECQIRIPRICNGNPETVVLAHLNGAGMGMKAPDIHGAFACSRCHEAVDGIRNADSFALLVGDEPDASELRQYHLEGVIRTQAIWLKEGILKA